MASTPKQKHPTTWSNLGTFGKGFGGAFLGCFGALVLFSALGFWVFGGHELRRCEVINKTDEPADITIWIFEKSFSVAALPPGEAFTFEYRPGSEGEYTVQVSFPSGHGYVDHEGYVDGGGYTDRILIRKTESDYEGLLEYLHRPEPTNNS